ncbi:MAG: hypothetical protein GX171_05790 [Clostridiales bacterium]|jgi:hypothetical protein|nr:hypothetical protein [Clostridiales bacterium]
MKKLYDETHPYAENDNRRSLWYDLDQADGLDFLFGPEEEYGVSFLQETDFAQLADTVLTCVKADLALPEAQGVTETHWVFYTQRVDGDAIGDKVRFTIMLRLKGRVVACDVMYSDFIFASDFLKIAQLKQALSLSVAEGLGL